MEERKLSEDEVDIHSDAHGNPANQADSTEENDVDIQEPPADLGIGTARKPPDRTLAEKFKKFLHDPKEGSYLGRTPKSWVLIFLFFVCFYAVVAGIWVGCFYIFLQIVSSPKEGSGPTYRGSEALIGNNPGVGVMNSHDHGHEHSHDHGHGHSHTHGLDHLGRGVQQRVPEEIPIHYKPAEQQFDLPLSAQFAQSSHYSSSNYDNVDVTTTPAPADVDPNINDEVFTPAYQTTPATPVDDVSIDGSIHQEQEEPSIDETKDQDEGGIFSSISSMFGSSTESSQVQTGDNPEGQEVLPFFHLYLGWK